MIAAPDNFLAQLPDLIATQIKARLPDLRTCQGMAGRLDMDALKRIGAAAPAVLVSRLRLSPSTIYAGPLSTFTLQMAAFIVTRDVLAQRRDLAEGVISQSLVTLIPDNTWGLAEHLHGADRVTAEPLVTAESEKAGVAIAAVTWSHEVGFGPVPAGSTVIPELYVSGPGEDHQQIGGEP